MSFTACTVATCAQYPSTRVLARSLAQTHPDVRLVTLLVDAGPDGLPPDVLTPADIGVSDAELTVLVPAYRADQACAALLPQLLVALLAATHGPVVHLGAATVVVGDLVEPLTAALRDASLAVVPRTLRPLPDDDRRPSPGQLRDAGVYEPGVLAVTEGAEHFLREWADAALRDPDNAGAFLDGAPALVEHHVIRDPGIGLSYWNAAQRPLIETGATITAGGMPLRTAHFDGFDPDRPWLLCADLDRPRVLLSEHPVLNELCAAYRKELAVPVAPPHQGRHFGELPDGTELPSTLRDALRTAWHGDGIANVDRWLADRWPDALWRDDAELQRRFPGGAGGADFKRWCATDGVASGRLPLGAIQAEEPAELREQLGVSVLGSGALAESLRLAVSRSGLPSSDEPIYPVVLCTDVLCTLPERHVVAVRIDPDPDSRADEVWTPSELPFPVVDTTERDEHDRIAARQRLCVADEVLFAAVLDLAAGADGGAVDLARAFAAAFADRTDARLVIFATPDDGQEAERVRLAVADDPRVTLVDAPLSEDGLLAADWLVCWQQAGTAGSASLRMAIAAAAARGVPVITRRDGVAAELFDADSAVSPAADDLPDVLRELADDHGAAAKAAAAARDRILATFGPTVAGDILRNRVERAYRAWRARRALDEPEPQHDPLQPLRAARHALLRQPDVEVGYKIPMAPALRKAVLRVLNHYDSHLRTVLTTLLDSVERSTSELVAGQRAAVDVEALRAQLDQAGDDLTDRVQAGEDAVLRLRADLVTHGRNLAGLSAAVADEAAARHAEMSALVERLQRLTAVMEATSGRIDAIEVSMADRFAERDARAADQQRSATQALQATDALRRVVVRAHERSTELDGDLEEIGAPTALVLCDAGLLRLPAEDSMMLPVLSSNGVWEPAIAELVDSLIEPDGVFLDVGAYVGYHCLRVLSRLGTSGAVVAVEPDETAANLVRHNVSANVSGAVADRLAVVRAAAWDSEVPLLSDAASGGGITVRPADGVDVTTASSGESGIRAVRLDRELDSSGVLRGLPLSVVKVDVPGRAHRAVGGLVRLLRRDRPQVVCTFTGPMTSGSGGAGEAQDSVLTEFGRLGYELLPLGSRRPVEAAEAVEQLSAGALSTLWLRPRTGR